MKRRINIIEWRPFLAFLLPLVSSLDAAEPVRVIGGQAVSIAEHPYQVALLNVPFDESDLFGALNCGGSIIARQWILTAAHCSTTKRPPEVAVAVGISDLKRPESGRVFRVDRIVIHPHYNSRTEENDFALWRLAEPIDFDGDYVAGAIELMTPRGALAGATDPGRIATITGWGRSSTSPPSRPSVLQAAKVPLTDQSSYSAGSITADMLMAGYPEGGIDACKADSGGPLVIHDSDGNPQLVGVTSWGTGCAEPGFPGVYARVSAAYPWILQSVAVNELFVSVDWKYAGPQPDGSLLAPYRNLIEGFAAVMADGVIRVASGDYGVAQPLAGKPVRIEPRKGVVRLHRTAPPLPPALVVHAGPDLTIATDDAITILAREEVAGAGPVTSWKWQQVSGPGSIVSKDLGRRDLTFWVTVSGPYVLRVIGSNGQLTDDDTVEVRFLQETLRVDAGKDRGNVPFPGSLTLGGVVLVDGAPSSEVTVRWRLAGKPDKGHADIGSPTSLSTTVTPTRAGVYRFVLDAWYRGRHRQDAIDIGFGVSLSNGMARVAKANGSNSAAVLDLAVGADGTMTITLSSLEDHPYMLQRSTNLVDWSDWKLITPTDGSVTIREATESNMGQFYRAISQ